MFVTLDLLKKHLNIDEEYTGEDDYLMMLSGSAEEFIGKYIDRDLEEVCEENGGDLPLPILHAILILTANHYANRESIAFTSVSVIPFSMEVLLDPYRKISLNSV